MREEKNDKSVRFFRSLTPKEAAEREKSIRIAAIQIALERIAAALEVIALTHFRPSLSINLEHISKWADSVVLKNEEGADK